MPQADGQTKNRPVPVLRQFPLFGDQLICGFSTQLHQRVVGFDDLLVPSDSEFAASGLRADSLIRLSFLGLAAQDSIAGVTEFISVERHHGHLRRLSRYLTEHLP